MRRMQERLPRTYCRSPCGECKKGYRELIADHPFDYSSPDAFFVSTVVLHNLVNQKLIDGGDTTKRIMSIEEARQMWNRPEPTDRA